MQNSARVHGDHTCKCIGSNYSRRVFRTTPWKSGVPF